jgi:hypothetical protein
MPLAVKTKDAVLGFSVSLEENPTEATLKSAVQFTKKFKNTRVLILSPATKHERLAKNIFMTSFAEVL